MTYLLTHLNCLEVESLTTQSFSTGYDRYICIINLNIFIDRVPFTLTCIVSLWLWKVNTTKYFDLITMITSHSQLLEDCCGTTMEKERSISLKNISHYFGLNLQPGIKPSFCFCFCSAEKMSLLSFPISWKFIKIFLYIKGEPQFSVLWSNFNECHHNILFILYP